MKITYDYLISYTANKNIDNIRQSINGMTLINRTKKIKSNEDVRDLRDYLEKDNDMSNVVFNNIILIGRKFRRKGLK